MCKKVILRANAKVNLNLKILETLPDGYHTIRTVMQSLSLHDRIRIERRESGITLSCNRPYIPTDERNLAYKAVRALEEFTGTNLPVFIRMDKRIPTQAGLGGGSADCAAVLVGLNKLYELGLPMCDLITVGGALGTDVPVCLLGGTRLGEHLGETLSPLPPMPDCAFLVVKPPFGINTARAYAQFEHSAPPPVPDPEETIAALHKRDLAAVAKSFGNTFEALCEKKHMIDGIKEQLTAAGALGAGMTGSGSAVFGVFASRPEAEKAREAMPKKYERFVCRPVKTGVKIEYTE